MGSAGNLMTASYAAQGVNSLTTAYANSEAYKAKGEYDQRLSELNAKASEAQAADALQRGSVDANTQHRKTEQLLGAQRAAGGAEGVDLNSGSFADIQGETRTISAVDEATIRNNAWREALGFKVEANNARARGEFSRLSADEMARSTLVTGGLGAIGYGARAGYNYKKGKG